MGTRMDSDNLLHAITRFYLESSQFNGIPLRELLSNKATRGQTLEHLRSLVLEKRVAIVYGDDHPNPHIRALPERHNPTTQAEMLKTSPLVGHACAYPLSQHLEKVVDQSKYAGEPYKLAPALGAPQLSFRTFDMMVLETYRNDPRYHYDCDDIIGRVSITSQHYGASTTSEGDRILLQNFGFAYDDDLNKYVAVFLWYLSKLSPEHQRIWQAREIRKATRLHPDYFRAAILGQFPEKVSIYKAFTEELRVINEMAAAMGRPPLFRETGRPREFAGLLRPTSRELDAFVHLLDKMISDNLNKAFFERDVPDQAELARDDGGVEIRRLGTVQMLTRWIKKKFRLPESKPVEEMLSTFRDIRKLRQKPAHAVNENEFDQKYVHEQRELMTRAYGAVRTLRLLFTIHPAAKTVEVPKWLYEGEIWSC